MITALLAGAILLAAEGPALGTSGDAYQTSAQTNEPRPLAHIERDISAALKQEVSAKRAADRSTAVERLCAIHAEIVGDPRFAGSDTMKTYRAKIWSRLTRIRQEFRREAAREAPSEVLNKPAVAPAGEDDVRLAAATMASALSLADYSGGAPSGLLARGGAAQTASNAQSLIELIERTINPDFWDVNGGPGTIMYYPNLQCLVIRATGEVHEKIGGVIGGVRRAGR